MGQLLKLAKACIKNEICYSDSIVAKDINFTYKMISHDFGNRLFDDEKYVDYNSTIKFFPQRKELRNISVNSCFINRENNAPVDNLIRKSDVFKYSLDKNSHSEESIYIPLRISFDDGTYLLIRNKYVQVDTETESFTLDKKNAFHNAIYDVQLIFSVYETQFEIFYSGSNEIESISRDEYDSIIGYYHDNKKALEDKYNQLRINQKIEKYQKS